MFKHHNVFFGGFFSSNANLVAVASLHAIPYSFAVVFVYIFCLL